MTDEIPRRSRVDLFIRAEILIRGAIEEVESLGCHEQLTKAVIMLGDAQRSVADWYDGGCIGAPPKRAPADQSTICDDCGRAVCHCGDPA